MHLLIHKVHVKIQLEKQRIALKVQLTRHKCSGTIDRTYMIMINRQDIHAHEQLTRHTFHEQFIFHFYTAKIQVE